MALQPNTAIDLLVPSFAGVPAQVTVAIAAVVSGIAVNRLPIDTPRRPAAILVFRTLPPSEVRVILTESGVPPPHRPPARPQRHARQVDSAGEIAHSLDLFRAIPQPAPPAGRARP
jgi:hypothetical protein